MTSHYGQRWSTHDEHIVFNTVNNSEVNDYDERLYDDGAARPGIQDAQNAQIAWPSYFSISISDKFVRIIVMIMCFNARRPGH